MDRKEIKSISYRNMGKFYKTLIPLFFLILMVVACEDVNELHKKYLDRGETIYTGVVDSVIAYAGYERAMFTWLINADPRITRTMIYWEERAKSLEIPVNRTQSGELEMQYEMTSMTEGNYIFEFVTEDDDDHYSLAVEVSVSVYGEKYIQTLRNRSIADIIKQENGDMLIEWDGIASRAIQYVTVEYTNPSNGQTITIRVENDENETLLTGLNTGDRIRVYTTFLPENGLDMVDAPAREYTMPKLERELDKSKFTYLIFPGDNTSVNGDRNLEKIWDGTPDNPGILHTIENDPAFNFPHHFSFDLGVQADLSRFILWGRTDSPFNGHNVRYFELWGTDELKQPDTNESYWSSDSWKGDWKMLGDLEVIKPSGSDIGTNTDEDNDAWKEGSEFELRDVGRVRYIRLIVKRENWQGTNCVNIGEVTFYGDDSQ